MSALTDRVDPLFADWNKPTSPGCALAIIRDGEIVYQRGYGMADLERNVPITPDCLFDIGSTGKQFTAAIIAILESEGLISYRDSLRKTIPEMPAYADEITIQHLLYHTSGLRDYIELMELAAMPLENFYHEGELLALIARQKAPNFLPGSEYLYTNSGYFLLGLIAQRVAGKHLTGLIRELIFEPLGMADSTFNKEHGQLAPNRALSYSQNDDSSFSNEISLCGGFGDGPIYSNVGDLFLWDQNFYHNRLDHGPADLPAKLQERGSLANSGTIPYAHGLVIEEYRGLKSVSHGGSWAGYVSELLRFPDQRFTVICLCNLASMEPEALAREVADIYLEKEFSLPAPLRVDNQETEASAYQPSMADWFTGSYTSHELATDYILTDRGEQLFLQRSPHAPPEALHQTAPGTFKSKDLELRFANGSLSIATGRIRDIHFQKI